MEKIFVELVDGTTGFIYNDTVDYGDDIESLVGEKLNIHLDDENGNPIEKIGVVIDIAYTE